MRIYLHLRILLMRMRNWTRRHPRSHRCPWLPRSWGRVPTDMPTTHMHTSDRLPRNRSMQHRRSHRLPSSQNRGSQSHHPRSRGLRPRCSSPSRYICPNSPNISHLQPSQNLSSPSSSTSSDQQIPPHFLLGLQIERCFQLLHGQHPLERRHCCLNRT